MYNDTISPGFIIVFVQCLLYTSHGICFNLIPERCKQPCCYFPHEKIEVCIEKLTIGIELLSKSFQFILSFTCYKSYGSLFSESHPDMPPTLVWS